MRRTTVRVVAVAVAGLAFPSPFDARSQADTLDEEGMEIHIPDAQILSLSPDGRWLAARTPTLGRPEALCVYEVSSLTERACGDLDPRQVSMVDELVVWSPDSTRIAFTERVYEFLDDGDLWVIDASSGEVTNLTDDGYEGGLNTVDEADGPVHLDAVPAWAPDGGSIAVSRTTIIDGQPGGNEIVRVDVDSGDVVPMALVGREVAVVGLVWAPDGERVYYSVDYLDSDEPDNGVWGLDTATGETTQITPVDPQKGTPVLVEVSATGTTGLIVHPRYISDPDAAGDAFALVDLESGAAGPIDPALADDVQGTRVATFSPTGTRVLYWRYDGNTGRLLVRDLPDGEPLDVVSTTEFVPALGRFGSDLDWASDGTVLTATSPDAGSLLHIDPEGGCCRDNRRFASTAVR
jgi:hypothetical protein